MKKPFGIKMKVLAFSALALMASSTFTSCTDEPDEESRFTFTGELIADHLKNNPDKYSNFCKILEQAKIGKKAGSMLTTLSTYGSYTCFAPTNEAVERYIQAKYNEYKASVDSFNANPEEYRIIHTGITSPRLEDLSDSMAAVIAKNHIIEQGFTTIEVGNGAFPKKTMNRRSVMLGWSTDQQGYSIATVDGVEMLEQNIKTENGYVHSINGALTPSDQPTPSLLASQSEFSLFSEALTKTGLDEYLSLYETHPDYDGIGLYGPPFQTQNKQEPPYPETNNQGFTLLVETDDLFADPSKNSFGMSIQSLDDLVEFAEKWYKYDEEIEEEELKRLKKDYTNPDNALYKFVAYHIIDRKLLYKSGKGPGGFIMEGYQTISQEGEIDKGRFDSEENMPTNFDRYDYFETALPYTSIKITKPYTNNGELKNALVANYAQEMGTRCVVSGMELHTNVVIEDASTTTQRPGLEDFEQQAVNGMIYTIDKILVYNEVEMAGNVLDERMRWDIFSLFPELTNNDVRWAPEDATYTLTFIPEDYSTRLRHNNTDTHIYYLRPHNAMYDGGYANYQGDEMLVTGKYDFQYRIPYVPEGYYEIRFGFSASDARGVAQFYFGEEGKLHICGIPLDMRNSEANLAFMGWFDDDEENEEENRKDDKAMRNRGFMKAPASIYLGSYEASKPAKSMRYAKLAFRRIIGTYELKHGKNYWLRFKDVTEGGTDDKPNEFNQDYLEIVPVGIINNLSKPEDIY